jgi:hypothetical protein
MHLDVVDGGEFEQPITANQLSYDRNLAARIFVMPETVQVQMEVI